MTRVVALRPDTVIAATSPGSLAAALDGLESAADEAGVLFADVELQLALARYLAGIVGSISLGSEPSVAQVHAIRELRLAVTELRELVVGYRRSLGRR